MEDIYVVGGAKYNEMKTCFENNGEGYVDPQPPGLVGTSCPVGSVGKTGVMGLIWTPGDNGLSHYAGLLKSKPKPLVIKEKKHDKQPWKNINKQFQIKNKRFKNK